MRRDETAPGWHVGPWVDSFAYAFSGVFVLIPMTLLGDSHRVDYLGLYILVLALTDVHRHYGLPQVYLDREVFRRHPLRFTVFPALMFGLFVASPSLLRSGWTLTRLDLCAIAIWIVGLTQVLRRDRANEPSLRRPLQHAMAAAVIGAAMGGFIATVVAMNPAWGLVTAGLAMSWAFARPYGSWLGPIAASACVGIAFIPMQNVPMNRALAAVAVIAGAWNIWHVFMQKYGVLRLYASKRRSDAVVPGWVDRLLIFSWLPLIAVHIGVRYQSTLFRLFPSGRTILGPVVDLLALYGSLVRAPLILLVVAAIVIFAAYEWRARVGVAPRLVMAAGITMVSAAFFFVHPLKAYLAYAFSHAVEYMVFIWAVQRRRYAKPLPHKPLLARALSRPGLVYIGGTLALGALFIYWKYVGRGLLPDAERPSFLGRSALEWVGYWTVYQSMVHFYFDGFMWKMRDPAMKRLIASQ